jgi:hypothetical protein
METLLIAVVVWVIIWTGVSLACMWTNHREHQELAKRLYDLKWQIERKW